MATAPLTFERTLRCLGEVDGGLRFVDGGWPDANADHRARFGDWPLLLDRVAVLAETA